MTYKTKARTLAVIKYALMYVGPFAAAWVIWGNHSGEASNPGWWTQFGFWTYVAAFTAGLAVVDFIGNQVNQMAASKQISFAKTHAGLFAVMAGLFWFSYFIAYEAAIFATAGFMFHIAAKGVELVEKRMYLKIDGDE